MLGTRRMVSMTLPGRKMDVIEVSSVPAGRMREEAQVEWTEDDFEG